MKSISGNVYWENASYISSNKEPKGEVKTSRVRKVRPNHSADSIVKKARQSY